MTNTTPTTQPSPPSDNSMSHEPESAAEITRRAKSAFVWVGSTTAVWQITTWLFTLYTAKLLNPADYGLVAMAETINPYLALLGAMNLPTWMIQAKEFPKKDQESIFTLCLLSGAAMMLFSMAAAPLVGGFYGSREVVLPLQVMAVTFLVRGLGALPDSLLRREMRFQAISLMNVSVGLMRGVLQLTMAYHGYGYWALVAGIVFKEVAECVWLIAVRGLPKRLGWDRELYRQALGFGIPATFATICWIIYSSADTIFVAKMFGMEMLGFYGMALALIDMPLSKLNSVIRPILYPYFARLRHIDGALEPAFLKVVRLITSLVFPTLLGLASVADPLIPLVLGQKWAQLVPTLQVLCAIGLVKAFMDNLSVLFLALGKPKLVLYFNILGMLTLPPSFYLFGKAFGLHGIYAAWLTVLPLLCLVNLSILKAVTGIAQTRFFLNSKAPFVSSLVMVLVVVGMNRALAGVVPAPVTLALEIAIGALTYAGLYYLCFRSDYRELIKSRSELRVEA